MWKVDALIGIVVLYEEEDDQFIFFIPMLQYQLRYQGKTG